MSGEGGAALRVSQLDAAELDSEIVSLTKVQLEKLFKYHQSNFLAKYDPEINAAIKLLIWKFTVDASNATIGQQMLSLKYRNEHAHAVTMATAPWHWISRRQKILYALLLIGCPWLRDRSSDLIHLFRLSKWKDKVDNSGGVYLVQKIHNLLRWTETGLKVASLVNFLVFLRQGVYVALIERLLGIRSVFPRKQGMRQVTFEYMTRELLWHGFSEFLFFILPLINFQRIKNFIVSKLLPRKPLGDQGVGEMTPRDLTRCAVCRDWPINPQEIGCQHVFCFFCIQSNFKADPDFCCPLCRRSVGYQSNIEPVKIALYRDTDR